MVRVAPSLALSLSRSLHLSLSLLLSLSPSLPFSFSPSLPLSLSPSPPPSLSLCIFLWRERECEQSASQIVGRGGRTLRARSLRASRS